MILLQRHYSAELSSDNAVMGSAIVKSITHERNSATKGFPSLVIDYSEFVNLYDDIVRVS
jgi:hypothetical protein